MSSLPSSLTGLRWGASSWFEVYVAFSTFMMLLRTAINDLIPQQLRSFINSKLYAFFSYIHPNYNKVSLKITQFWDRSDGNINELYHAARQYLPSRITRTYKSLEIGKLKDHNNLVFAVDGKEDVVDQFHGINFTWKLVKDPEKDSSASWDPSPSRKSHYFVLSFSEKHREIVMNKYIPHVLTTYEAIKTQDRVLKLHSYSKGHWNKSELSHPATFDTLALDPELKQTIIDDLERFLKRKEMYKRVGKPWKRGYLLYGPPGTGKSSLIAAMANHLKFDVYNLELTAVVSNSDLMHAMRMTSRRSIIVVEDIDCIKEVHARSPSDSDSDDVKLEVEDANAKSPRFTLSGLLNCMDGLWSSRGEERIIIFTTNHKEKIDPALLRPGRMDRDINLSFLKPKAFRILASNYLDIQDHHPLFQHIEHLLEKTEVTPAVVAEQLLRSEDPDVALDQLLKFLIEMDIKREAKNPDP